MIFILEDDRGWESYYRRLLKGQELAFFHDGIAGFQIQAGSQAEIREVPVLPVTDAYAAVDTGLFPGCRLFH